MLDGVLGRQHHERLRQRQRGPLDRNLVFLHGLEQGGLRFGRGAVHLVGQQHLAEDRPLAEDEIIAFAVENIGPGDVGGEQVGGELEPLVLRAQDAGKRLGQGGLGDAGHALEQDVTGGEQGDEELVRHRLHAHHHARHLGQGPVPEVADALRPLPDGHAVAADVEPRCHNDACPLRRVTPRA